VCEKNTLKNVNTFWENWKHKRNSLYNAGRYCIIRILHYSLCDAHYYNIIRSRSTVGYTYYTTRLHTRVRLSVFLCVCKFIFSRSSTYSVHHLWFIHAPHHISRTCVHVTSARARTTRVYIIMCVRVLVTCECANRNSYIICIIVLYVPDVRVY